MVYSIYETIYKYNSCIEFVVEIVTDRVKHICDKT